MNESVSSRAQAARATSLVIDGSISSGGMGWTLIGSPVKKAAVIGLSSFPSRWSGRSR